MKITIYTIKDCAFSKQEKEYFILNKLQYVEKDLESNKEFLTEMMAISNNFAATPVTQIEKDDGTIVVLKGFVKKEFDTTFGFTSQPSATKLGGQFVQPKEELVNPITPDPLKSIMDKLESKSQPTEQLTPPLPPGLFTEEI